MSGCSADQPNMITYHYIARHFFSTQRMHAFGRTRLFFVFQHFLYRISEIISFVFLIVVAFLSLFALYSKHFNHNGLQIFSVVSGSMHPEIPVGSAVFVLPQQDYFVHDIITYRFENHRVTHRIVYAGRYFLTKGDANTDIDSRIVQKEQIIGKVLFSLPYLGSVQEATKTLRGIIFFIWLPALAIIAHESFIVYRELSKLYASPSMALRIPSHIVIIFFLCGGLCMVSNIYSFYTTSVDGLVGVVTTGSFDMPQPSPPVTPLPSSSPLPSVSPSPCDFVGHCHNGVGTINSLSVTTDHFVHVTQANTASVSSQIYVSQETGYNTQHSSVNGTTSVHTGTSLLRITIDNQVNANIVSITSP